MLSACAPDVVNETDLYGSFLTEDNTRSITLAADNAAVVSYGDKADRYYARYDLINELIELRVDGFRGDVAYTIKIVNADTLELKFTPERPADPSKPSDNDSVKDDEQSITFIRDKSFDPAI